MEHPPFARFLILGSFARGIYKLEKKGVIEHFFPFNSELPSNYKFLVIRAYEENRCDVRRC